jgi:hypothetical protein
MAERSKIESAVGVVQTNLASEAFSWLDRYLRVLQIGLSTLHFVPLIYSLLHIVA